MTEVYNTITADGYQAGIAFIAATIAAIVMIDAKVAPIVIAFVSSGVFWFAWLGYNTVRGRSQPLFYTDGTKLWDVALKDGRGFLIVAVVVCLFALTLWVKQIKLTSTIFLLVGAIYATGLYYDLFTAGRPAVRG